MNSSNPLQGTASQEKYIAARTNNTGRHYIRGSCLGKAIIARAVHIFAIIGHKIR
jgi:hypothetical protein